MEQIATVTIHPSCFPERTRAVYIESFQTRQMNHRFHYESEKQAQQWLALHEAYSPARTDDDCARVYARAFSEIAQKIDADEIAVISIGCGGGQKDLSLLQLLRAPNLRYVPGDVSVPLALTAHLRATRTLKIDSKPLAMDLSASSDLPAFLDRFVSNTTKRVIGFFGMLPNFEPAQALGFLSKALRADDVLIVSANLAPGPDYAKGVRQVLPLYDNELTRRWLATVLLDAGLDVRPEHFDFTVRAVGDLLRIEVSYRFRELQIIRLDAHKFTYAPGEVFRLFFSYRHTPEILRELLSRHQIEATHQWITASGEEGVFLCRKII